MNSLKQCLASKSPENVEELERVKPWLRTPPPPAEEPVPSLSLVTTRWLPLDVEPFRREQIIRGVAVDRLPKLGREEFDEYHRCRLAHEADNPGYHTSWGRPKPETVDAVWKLLAQRLYMLPPQEPKKPRKRPQKDAWKQWDGRWQPWCGPFPNPEKVSDLSEYQETVTKQAALISILCAVNCGLTRKMLTQTKLIEELARYFSDHWRFMEEGLGRRVSWNDITPATQEGAWRDLVRNQISVERLWYLITQLIPGQFPDDAYLYGVSLDRKANGGYSVLLDERSTILRELGGKVSGDPGCRRPVYRHSLVPAGVDMPERRERSHVAGERPYNKIEYGKRSLDLLDALDSITLLFDTGAFIKRYEESSRIRGFIDHELLTRGVKSWRLPHGEFRRRLDAACHQLSGWATATEDEQKEMRGTIEPLLKQRDRRNDFLVAYRGVYETAVRHNAKWQQGADKLMGAEGSTQLLEIQTRWYKTLNGRYQTASLWPLSVTAKKLSKLTDLATPLDVEEIEGPRREWFRICGQPGVGDDKPQRLVGLDVVASQYQLYALILNIPELEDVVFKPGFRDLLIEKARPYVREEDYPADDPAAQERFKTMVKKLNLVDGYDAQTHETVRAMRSDPETFGLGFSTEGAWKGGEQRVATRLAKEYLASVPGHPHIEKFRLACRRIATVAYKGIEYDKERAKEVLRYQGVSFSDPFDGSTVLWNPPQRIREASRWGSIQATYSPPGRRVTNAKGRAARKEFKAREAAELQALSYLPCGDGAYGIFTGKRAWKKAKAQHRKEWTAFESNPMNAEGRYPIDVNELRRAIAPCTIHRTDGLFSSLVMKKLTDRGVAVVGLHDAWCVGEWVPDGKGGQMPGEDLLRQVIEEVGEEWLTSLGPIYDFLDKYLLQDDSDMPEVPGTPSETYSAYAKRLRRDWEDRVSVCESTGIWPRFHTDRSR